MRYLGLATSGALVGSSIVGTSTSVVLRLCSSFAGSLLFSGSPAFGISVGKSAVDSTRAIFCFIDSSLFSSVNIDSDVVDGRTWSSSCWATTADCLLRTAELLRVRTLSCKRVVIYLKKNDYRNRSSLMFTFDWVEVSSTIFDFFTDWVSSPLRPSDRSFSRRDARAVSEEAFVDFDTFSCCSDAFFPWRLRFETVALTWPSCGEFNCGELRGSFSTLFL